MEAFFICKISLLEVVLAISWGLFLLKNQRSILTIISKEKENYDEEEKPEEERQTRIW